MRWILLGVLLHFGSSAYGENIMARMRPAPLLEQSEVDRIVQAWDALVAGGISDRSEALRLVTDYDSGVPMVRWSNPEIVSRVIAPYYQDADGLPPGSEEMDPGDGPEYGEGPYDYQVVLQTAAHSTLSPEILDKVPDSSRSQVGHLRLAYLARVAPRFTVELLVSARRGNEISPDLHSDYLYDPVTSKAMLSVRDTLRLFTYLVSGDSSLLITHRTLIAEMTRGFALHFAKQQNRLGSPLDQKVRILALIVLERAGDVSDWHLLQEITRGMPERWKPYLVEGLDLDPNGSIGSLAERVRSQIVTEPPFVVYAHHSLILRQSTSVTGDVGAREKQLDMTIGNPEMEITILEGASVAGNLYADSISISNNAQINGKAIANEILAASNAALSQPSESPILLPVLNPITAFPPAEPGTGMWP